jgi:arylsulfatase A-like enzyme
MPHEGNLFFIYTQNIFFIHYTKIFFLYTKIFFEAFSGNGELCGMTDVTCKTNSDGYRLLPDARHQEMRRAYYSVITFMDSQLGKVLDGLHSQTLADNTILCLWGDHGYQLGEHGQWGKVTNFELATRVPLIIGYPSQMTVGVSTKGFASLLDVYPTLVELAGLPPNPTNEGVSLVPLLKQPKNLNVTTNFNASFSMMSRAKNVMGLSMRIDNYRFTRWATFNKETGRPSFTPYNANNTNVKYELYNHTGENDFGSDFDAYENENLASRAEHNDLVKELDARLQRTWDRKEK